MLKPSFHRVLAECRSKLAQLHAEGPLAAMEEGLFRLEALVNLQQEYQQCVPAVPVCVSDSMGTWQTCTRASRRRV